MLLTARRQPMTSFIAIPDLHDRSESIKAIARELAEADAVLLPGDMTNGSINHLLRLFSILEEFNEHVYAVPGNMDTPRMLALMAREGLSLHRRFQMLDGVALAGVGGALPFAGRFVFSEDETAQHLEDAVKGLPPGTPLLLVSHQPPANTALDRLPNGAHVGSHAVRRFIERWQPLACVCGHIHEATGVDTIGDTVLLNPGPLWQSQQYAYIEIENGALLCAQLRSAQHRPDVTYHKGIAWQTNTSSSD
jgi:Icc-related predicted phosphoesterase